VADRRYVVDSRTANQSRHAARRLQSLRKYSSALAAAFAAQASASRPSSRPSAAHLGPLDVTRAQRASNADELGIYNLGADQLLSPEIKLLGVNRDRDDVLSGETVLLSLFWQAVQKPAQDYTATIKLVDDQKHVVLLQDFPLGDGRYPTSRWNANERSSISIVCACRPIWRMVRIVGRCQSGTASQSIWANCACVRPNGCLRCRQSRM
jgi:hypothetical protein